ncbi:MAG: YcbK family protein [Elusimicrobiales bacterium]
MEAVAPSLTEKLLLDIENSILPAKQETTEDDVRDLEDAEGSDADIFISSAMPEPPPPVNLGGNGSLTLTRQDTGEKLNARYRNKDGTYNQPELDRITRLMRCSLTGREMPVPIKLVELLDAVEDKFGKKGLILLSGYRTPKLNGQIPGAARNSLHMLGWAADIKIPGYSSTTIKKYGLKRGAGGVGYYPSKGFTHLDVGKVRYWVVKKPPRKRYVRRARRAPARVQTMRKGKKTAPRRQMAVKRAPAKKKPA